MTVEISQCRQVDDEVVAAFAHLIPQLSSSSPPPDAEALSAIVDNPHSVLFLAHLDGAIVGSLTLAFYRIPTGVKAWIEDVVVDGAAARGAKNVSLTSRASREAANRLYQRIGFELYETNLYRYQL